MCVGGWLWELVMLGLVTRWISELVGTAVVAECRGTVGMRWGSWVVGVDGRSVYATVA